MNQEITIITEGEFDAAILDKLLSEKKYNVKYRILPASGYSSALSKVKSLLSKSDKKIVLLLDTDTTDPVKIAEKKDFVNSYIDAKTNKYNLKTVWAIPEFEIIFLSSQKFLHGLTRHKIDKNLLELGKNAPEKMLQSISPLSKRDYILLLNDKEIADDFFNGGVIKEISDFIEA